MKANQNQLPSYKLDAGRLLADRLNKQIRLYFNTIKNFAAY